ncbi:uncharacterized protein LOC143288725 [Babylonia areolata]|uniref:uncharacterized protein LOC143288725 n=1 Tax=Babylonia areolata TaxID=304850 RepID=UPI003FD21D8A
MTRNIRVATIKKSNNNNNIDDDGDEDLSDLTDEEERLFTAIAFAKLHKIPALLSQARDVEIRGQHACTPLLYAARYAHGEHVTYLTKLLVRQGCDVNAQDDAGMTSLMHLLDRRGPVDAMRPLLRNRSLERDRQDVEGNTTLMHAARVGNCEVVASLLSSSPPFSPSPPSPSSPPPALALPLSSSSSSDTSSSFSSSVAAMPADLRVKNAQGMTALDLAVEAGHAECCGVLIKGVPGGRSGGSSGVRSSGSGKAARDGC